MYITQFSELTLVLLKYRLLKRKKVLYPKIKTSLTQFVANHVSLALTFLLITQTTIP